MSVHPAPATWPRRLLVALGVVALLSLVTLLVAWNRAAPETTQAAGPGPGMSLAAPATVFVGLPFTLTISTTPAPEVEISGFGSEVLFPKGLKWQQRASCDDEVQVDREDEQPLSVCLAVVTTPFGGVGHSVLSEVAVPPLAALNVTPGSTTTLVELDFVCNAPGSYKLTLTAVPESGQGAAYNDLNAVAIFLKTVPQDYDGDTSPNNVADTLVINCVEPPTPTPTPIVTPTPTPTPTVTPTPTPTPTATPTVTPTPPKIDTDGDGCLDNRESGPDETLGGRRDHLNFWDFFDPNRDRSVTLLDFLAVLRHFGTVGNPATLDPDGPEPLAGEYWASADRGGQAPGGDPWDELPANGSITFTDFLSVLRQFGHTCA